MKALTVIVCEDEPLIALDLCQQLEGLHCTVLEIENSNILMSLCLELQVDLIILNVKLQQQFEGVILAKAIRKVANIPVLLITGARAEDFAASQSSDPDITILHKPFTQAQLRKLIEDALAP